MFEFLQGFALGLLLSCPPWFLLGLVRPDLADPGLPPRRWQVILRYALVLPFAAFLLAIISLWGGFGASLPGFLAGLLAVAVEVPVERRWRRWQARRAERRREAERDREALRQREALEREQREAGVFVLDPARPPVDADDVVLGLCAAKGRLLALRRPDLAGQADRLYTRYARALEVFQAKFDARELTFERSRGMVAEVCRGALDNLTHMASLVGGVASIDAEYVRRRLQRERRLSAQEREALEGRLALVADTERRVRELSGRNEAALTALDQAAVAVARLETDRPQASITADLALADLQRFVSKAELYGRRRE